MKEREKDKGREMRVLFHLDDFQKGKNSIV